MITITAVLDGEVILDRKLAALEERMSDMTPAYPELTRVFRSIVAKAFDSEGSSGDTGKWAPLKPRTVAERKRLGFGAGPILQRKGTLKRSLTSSTSDSISVETPTYFAIGSAVPYVVFHQSTQPRQKLPRRPVVALTSDQKNQIFLPLRRYVTGHEPGAGTRSPVR